MNLPDIQLVVSDLDGTLLDPQSYISAGALEAIAALRQRGVLFSIASGRGYFLMMPMMQRLELDTPAILSGGALILQPGGQVVDAQPLALADAAALLANGRNLGLGVSFHEIDRVCAEAPDPIWERGISRNWLPDLAEPVPAFERSFDLMAGRSHAPLRVDLFGPAEMVDRLAAALPGQFPQLQIMKVVGHLEITRAGVNKGSALARLADYLRVPLRQVMVLGDDINDLSMFSTGAFSVAMGNGYAPLKAFADAVAPANSEGGFAAAVQKYVLGR